MNNHVFYFYFNKYEETRDLQDNGMKRHASFTVVK